MGLTPPVAGDLLGPPIIVMKQADEDRQNTSTVSNDSELFIDIGPNEQWLIHFILFVGGNSSGDIRVAISTPTGCLGTFTSFGLASAATTSGNLQADGETLSGGQSGDHGSAAPGVGSVIGLQSWAGLLNAGNAGKVRLMWAQLSANNASATKLLKGSCMVCHRIK